ncbi:actin-related protein 6 [Spinellus fusiger]|nr:actin-related protein 6 [Spinellus fusiger]
MVLRGLMRPTVVLDHGANTIKAGVMVDDLTDGPRPVMNAIIRGRSDKRSFVGDQFDNCTDFSSLFYRLPFERGFLTNWGVERTLWDRLFKHMLKVDPKESRLLITEPCFNLPTIQDTYDQIIFEEYEFNACYRTIAPQLCIFNDIATLFGDKQGSVPDCAIIVDSGFSFTHIVPFLRGRPLSYAIKRINVGGKLLTNQLKETISFRHYDMMEETYIINQVKEACCYISQDIVSDLGTCRKSYRENSIIQEYVLSDFTQNSHGYIRPKKMTERMPKNTEDPAAEQILPMNNERFMIPEILFHPSDIGMQQAGIPEAIVQAVEACAPELHGLLYANIVLVGGNANFKGYKERIGHDLRKLIPTQYTIRLSKPDDPINYAWFGGERLVALSAESDLQQKFVSRKDYMEHGSNICKRRFNSL